MQGEFLTAALTWLRGQPVISVLLLLMALDVVAGTAVAIGTKTLSSPLSWQGMSRKVLTLILVGVAVLVEPFTGDLPLSKMVALFYTATEALSIVENAAVLGVPLPAPLLDALVKMRESKTGLPLPPTGTRVEVTTPGASSVDVRTKPDSSEGSKEG